MEIIIIKNSKGDQKRNDNYSNNSESTLIKWNNTNDDNIICSNDNKDNSNISNNNSDNNNDGNISIFEITHSFSIVS